MLQMIDRTTKGLLLAIAVGIWLNAGVQFFTTTVIGQAGDSLRFFEQWLIKGAPVRVTQ